MLSLRFALPLSFVVLLAACGSRSDLADRGAIHDAGSRVSTDAGASSIVDASVVGGSWPTHPGTLVATLGGGGEGIAFTSFATPTSPLPSGTIRGTWQDSALQGLAFDTQGRIYVVEYQAVASEPPGRVVMFDRGRTTPSRVVGGASLGASYLTGLAVDTLGNIYVLRNDGPDPTSGVVVFGPGSDTTPIRWIHGPSTGLEWPNGLAVGTDGTIYVGNTAGEPISVFAADADGDARPIARLGSASGAAGPEGIALDGTGRVYFTATAPVPAVVVLFEGAMERMISGPNTGLDSAVPIAVDGDGRIYVGSYGGGDSGFRVFAPGASGDVAPETVVSKVYGLGLALMR